MKTLVIRKPGGNVANDQQNVLACTAETQQRLGTYILDRDGADRSSVKISCLLDPSRIGVLGDIVQVLSVDEPRPQLGFLRSYAISITDTQLTYQADIEARQIK